MTKDKFKALKVYALIFALVASVAGYNNLTERRLNSLHPVFAEKLEKGLIEMEKKHPEFDGVEITSAYRSFAEQDKLYRLGKTPCQKWSELP